MLRRHRFVTLAVALAGLPALLAVGGCSGARDSSTSAAGAPAAAPGVAAPDSGSEGGSGQVAGQLAATAAPEAQAAPGGADRSVTEYAANDAGRAAGTAGAKSGSAVSNPSALTAAQLIRTADVVVQVDQLGTASARARAVAQSVGGSVSSEVTAYPDAPAETVVKPQSDTTSSSDALPRSARPGESVLVLRVPVASLDQAVDRVTAIGTVLSRTSSSQDVTADLADLGSRVKTQRASVDRVRALLAKAGSLQDVVLLESELTRRESDLEALQARQAALADRAAMSTLTVTLRTPDVATTPDDSDPNGFVHGLKRAWEAVIASTVAILTLLGGLFPVLVLAALIGLPLWWYLRRRRAALAATAPAAPTTSTPPAAPDPKP